MTKRRLGELLQAEGLVTEEQVRAGLEEQRKSSLFLGEALVKLGFVSEEAIAHTIAQQFGLPFMSAMQCNISTEVLNIYPERMYYEYQFLAVEKMAKVLLIVGAGLMNHDVLDELERLSGCRVCQFVSTWKDIRSALEKYAKELKKSQPTELSDLGTLLLDSGAVPRPASAAAAAPAVTGAPAEAAASAPAVLKPAATTSAALPAAVRTPPVPAPVSPNTSMLRPQPASTVRPGVSGRLSALSKPSGSGSSQALPKVAVPAAAPVSGAGGAPAKAAESGEGQQQPAKAPGLLGLFKKS